jgi:hypothetical protein
MSQYVKCIKNQNYFKGHEHETYGDLIVGAIYKLRPFNPETDIPGMVRIIGEFSRTPGGEGGYLYPADYFEPFTPDLQADATASITVRLPPDLRHILHAEALDGSSTMSALAREWLTEHLDLAAS